ncbi:hypothetical protein GCM10007084_37580 [Parabacteroides faecis]|nr:hypothetical protein GCM10007084_37580 [Parabacteroides faecis]
MDIPESINTDGVHAQSFAHLYAMFPIFYGDSGVMNFGSLYNERLSIQQECFVSDFKGAVTTGLVFASGQYAN